MERRDGQDNGNERKGQSTYHGLSTHVRDAGLLGDGPSHLEPVGGDHLLLHVLHNHGVLPLGHVDELVGVVRWGTIGTSQRMKDIYSTCMRATVYS